MHLTFGNRCGHVSADPTLDLSRPIPVGPGGYPRILAVASECIERFYSSPATFPKLGVNPSSSQKRSERREAVVRLLKSILKFLDLVSLTVAIRDEKAELKNLNIAVLAKHADLELRRAERAIADLATAGFLFTVQQRVRLPDGGFRSVPAIKRVSPALFSAFDLALALKLERAKAQKRLAQKLAAASAPAQAPLPSAQPQEQQQFAFDGRHANAYAVATLTTHMASALGTIGGRPRDRLTRHDREPERQRRWNAIALTLREQHPDWTGDQIRAAANAAVLD